MKLHCAFCGKPMQSAAMLIGHLPVGPTCAKNAGLIEKVRKGVGALRLASRRAPIANRADNQLALDLVEEADA